VGPARIGRHGRFTFRKTSAVEPDNGVEVLEDDLEAIEENPAHKRKLLKAVHEFGSYIDANQDFIPNCGDRYLHDETIRTAFVESTVNYVVSKRFMKE
jgi:hypothetical protein